MSSSDTEADPPPQTPNSRLRQPVHNPKHTPKSDLKQQSAKTVVTNTEMKTVTTTKVTRRQLRKKQSERLAPVIVSNHTTPAPNTHNRTHAKRRQHTVGIPDHISMLPKRNESIQKHMTDNFPQNAKCSTDDFRSMDEIERDYFEEFDSSDTGSEAESDAGYSDDDFCADDEGEETQFCDKTVTELQFSLQTTQTQTAERSGSFSLPDLRGKSSSLVGSSNPSSSASIRSEGAAVKQPVSLQQRFAGDVPKQELSLPQLAEITQDSSTDETSTDDSYKEPLTPRSRAGGKRNSLSLPELPSHRPLFPVASLITPRGVDLVFAATDSDSSAPNTYRGPLNSNHDATNMHDNLPQISSRSVKTGALVGTPRGSVARVEQPDTWLYNKSQSQRKAGLRLVGANYNT